MRLRERWRQSAGRPAGILARTVLSTLAMLAIADAIDLAGSPQSARGIAAGAFGLLTVGLARTLAAYRRSRRACQHGGPGR